MFAQEVHSLPINMQNPLTSTIEKRSLSLRGEYPFLVVDIFGNIRLFIIAKICRRIASLLHKIFSYLTPFSEIKGGLFYMWFWNGNEAYCKHALQL